MDLDAAARTWQDDGYAVLPGYLDADRIAPAVAELPLLFPTGDEFHDDVDPERNARFRGDEFAGIDSFPFAAVEVSLLAVSEPVVTLAETLLGTRDLRLYSAEAWAKYEGAAEYDQDLHRDYLNHTILAPTTAPAFRQLELFVFLSEVTVELGAPRMVATSHTADVPFRPNFLPRGPGDVPGDGFTDAGGRPDLYAVETPATGPAGTVVAFHTGTVHRGAAITQARGSRYTMHLNFRPAAVEWGQRQGWADRSHDDEWYAFVTRATPRQLALFGFPEPGHAYWTDETLRAVGQRYPALDLEPWRTVVGEVTRRSRP